MPAYFILCAYDVDSRLVYFRRDATVSRKIPEATRFTSEEGTEKERRTGGEFVLDGNVRVAYL